MGGGLHAADYPNLDLSRVWTLCALQADTQIGCPCRFLAVLCNFTRLLHLFFAVCLLSQSCDLLRRQIDMYVFFVQVAFHGFLELCLHLGLALCTRTKATFCVCRLYNKLGLCSFSSHLLLLFAYCMSVIVATYQDVGSESTVYLLAFWHSA